MGLALTVSAHPLTENYREIAVRHPDSVKSMARRAAFDLHRECYPCPVARAGPAAIARWPRAVDIKGVKLALPGEDADLRDISFNDYPRSFDKVLRSPL